MSDVDDHKFVVEFRKYLRSYTRRYSDVNVKYLTQHSKIKNRKSITKPTVVSERKYILTGHQPAPANLVMKSVLLLPYLNFLKQQKKSVCKKRIKIPVSERYKIKQIDLQRRCGIDEFADDVKTILDTDKHFYSLVERQPQTSKLCYKSLQNIFHKLMLTNYEIALRKDLQYNICVQSRNENSKYDQCNAMCIVQAKQFQTFIADDYAKSVEYLQRSEMLKVKLDRQLVELLDVATKKFSIISRLLDLEHHLRVQQELGRFLYYLSPPSFRSSNRKFATSIEIERQGFDLGLGRSEDGDTFSVMFEKLVQECYTTPVRPVLYFKRPEDLMNVFNTLEMQQLNHFTHVNYIAPYVKKLLIGIKQLKEYIAVETAPLESIVVYFQSILKHQYDRKEHLKTKFFKILNEAFYESVGSADVMKLTVGLEFAYEQIFGEKPMYNDIVPMAKSLELFFLDTMKSLEKVQVQSKEIKDAVQKRIEAEKREMAKAETAHRELRLFNRLETRLRKAVFQSPTIKEVPKVSAPAEIPKTYSKNRKKTNILSISLTEAQLDHLLFFTDWNECEDPAPYLVNFEE